MESSQKQKGAAAAPAEKLPQADKAGWKEYLLQFVLMFLAVFLGFFADNLREAQAERIREKKYIRSIINDLKADTSKLSDNINYCDRLLEGQDSALALLYTQYNKPYNQRFFHFMGAFQTMPIFVNNDATIQQLKSSGGFLAISSDLAKDSIMLYEARVRQTLANEAITFQILSTTESWIAKIFNLYYFRADTPSGRFIPEAFAPTRFDHIISDDRLKWAELHNQFLRHKSFLKYMREQRAHLFEQAKALILFLGKEYDIRLNAAPETPPSGEGPKPAS